MKFFILNKENDQMLSISNKLLTSLGTSDDWAAYDICFCF